MDRSTSQGSGTPESVQVAAEAARLAEEQRRRAEAELRAHAAQSAAATSPLEKSR